MLKTLLKNTKKNLRMSVFATSALGVDVEPTSHLLEFKAGKLNMRDNLVTSDVQKGIIILKKVVDFQ